MDKNKRPQGIEESYFLFGLLNSFENRMQTMGDQFFEEISWKQFFVMICISIFSSPPTINELSDAVGCSHQNTKQLLIKLQRLGFIDMITDKEDKRKQRVVVGARSREFSEKYSKSSEVVMKHLFEGISKDELSATVRTVEKMDDNIRKIDVIKVRKKHSE